jgi:leucyl aminopeptidase
MNIIIENTDKTLSSSALVVFLSNEIDVELPEHANEILSLNDFKGKVGQVVCTPSFGYTKGPSLFVVGSGDSSADELRVTARAAGTVARKKGLKEVTIDAANCTEEEAIAIITGFAAGNYRFDKYKAKDKRTNALEKMTILHGAKAELAQKAIALIEGRNFCRDLVNAPPAELYPETMAQAARELEGDNLSVLVWDEMKLKEEKMNGIIAVGQGSINPGRFIHMHYKPAGEARKKIALVGKGVTFDAGGLSLKSSAGMLTMRCDMGGAGTVLGVFRSLVDLQPDVEVHGLIGAVENMCAANSYKLGDILTMHNGKTVEVHNTDAEGRLVLADCLSYGSKLGVDYMVDLATLTGACVVALGNHYTALFSNEEDICTQLSAAASKTGEGLWRMPLPDLYKSMLKAEWGDIKNLGGRAAGSITAALFLSEFVTDTKWAHLDIAGSAFYDSQFNHFEKGGTGSMVETLCEWILS